MDTATNKTVKLSGVIVVAIFAMLASAPISLATTKGLSQIVTPDLQPKGDIVISIHFMNFKHKQNKNYLVGTLELHSSAEGQFKPRRHKDTKRH